MTGDAATVVASIVITNHNYSRYIIAAVESALAQSMPTQVIVVDDGSTDGSVALLEAFAAANPEVRLIAKANGGQASALNAGWAAADAPVVFFLDGDDRLDSDAVAEVRYRLGGDAEAVRCQFRLRWIDEWGGAIDGEFPEPERLLPAGDLRVAMTANPDDIAWQPTSGNAFTTDLLRKIMPIPETGYRISADHYLSNISPLYGTVVAIEETLGDYRVHGDNADHRAGFDLDRIRSILVRTYETRQHLVSHGKALDLAGMPDSADGFRSLTTAGLRLISFRCDGVEASGRHPFHEDTLGSLLRRGVRAALTRADFSAARKAAGVAWIVALAAAPRRFVPAIAARALTR